MNSTPDLYQTIARLHLGKARKQSVSFTLREQKITQEAMESATGSNLTPLSKALSEDDKVLVRDTWREATKPEREAGQKLFKRRVLCADRLWCRYRTRSVGWGILKNQSHMFQAYYLQSTSIFFLSFNSASYSLLHSFQFNAFPSKQTDISYYPSSEK